MIEIQKAVEYLKEISLKEPKHIRVEEVEFQRIVLSFEEDAEYYWSKARQYKEFLFKEGKVVAMKSFPLQD